MQNADAGTQALCCVCLQAALKGAVSLCKRHSRDAAPAAAQELWFTVLQRYVARLRRLRQLARQQGVSPAPPEEAQCLAAAQVPTCVWNLTHDSQHTLQLEASAE